MGCALGVWVGIDCPVLQLSARKLYVLPIVHKNQFKDGRNDVLERENMTTVLQQLIRQHTANVRHTDPSSHDNILLLTSFSEG